MANSYDLTEDDRGFTFGRMVNIDLATIRNMLWAVHVTAVRSYDRELAYRALELLKHSQQLLEQ